MRRALGIGLLVWLVAAAAPHASAQPEAEESCRAPILAFPRAPNAFDPGGSYNLPFAVENPNGAAVEVARADIRVTTPDGWSAIPARRELTMGPNSVQQNVLAITAPSRGTGAASGNITVSVTFVCVRGVVQQSSLPAEHVLQVRIRAFDAPWPVVAAAFGILALGVAVLGIRRLRRGIILVPETPERALAPGKSAKYTFLVHNRRGKPARYHLLGLGVPAGWSLHLALEEVELEPGEEKALWAILKAPAGAAPGTAFEFLLRLQGERGAGDGATASFVARVEGGA